ncbi:hypothetical protein SEVIR_9G215855v4 [Setaria viridis]
MRGATRSRLPTSSNSTTGEPTSRPTLGCCSHRWGPPTTATSTPGGPACSSVEKLMPDKFPDGAAVPLTKPCRGLILIRCAHKGGYFVFNPSTGAVLPLKRIFRSKPFEPHAPPLFLKVSYGLGYCTVRKEHKVVRLFSNAEGGDGMTPTSCNYEVFVLDKPAYWRPSAAQPPLCSAMEKDPAVFIHGHLHFICSDGGGITTFNISDETFGSLSPPSGFRCRHRKVLRMRRQC